MGKNYLEEEQDVFQKRKVTQHLGSMQLQGIRNGSQLTIDEFLAKIKESYNKAIDNFYKRNKNVVVDEIKIDYQNYGYYVNLIAIRDETEKEYKSRIKVYEEKQHMEYKKKEAKEKRERATLQKLKEKYEPHTLIKNITQ